MSDTLFGPGTQRLFADAMAAQIAAAEASDQNSRHGDGDLASRIITDLRTAPVSPGPVPAAGQTRTVEEHLPRLLEDMPSTPLAETLDPFMACLDWYQIFELSLIHI